MDMPGQFYTDRLLLVETQPSDPFVHGSDQSLYILDTQDSLAHMPGFANGAYNDQGSSDMQKRCSK